MLCPKWPILCRYVTRWCIRRMAAQLQIHSCSCYVLFVVFLMQLSNFFTESYRQGGFTALLALSGLFILMQVHNLEYPRFYPSIYALLKPSILYSKYRRRFFGLLQLCLQSSHIPAYIVAAFIKRYIAVTMHRKLISAHISAIFFSIWHYVLLITRKWKFEKLNYLVLQQQLSFPFCYLFILPDFAGWHYQLPQAQSYGSSPCLFGSSDGIPSARSWFTGRWKKEVFIITCRQDCG